MSIQRLIDGVPSEEFYSAFHYTKILKLLGYEGPAKAGAYVRCPKCKTASMFVSTLMPFEGWMYCDKCKTSCEGLRLYGLAYKISTPEELVEQLSNDLKIKSVNPQDTLAYYKFYDRYYSRINKVWELCRSAMAPVANRFAVSRLNELNLWLNQDVFNRAFSDWFGYGYKHEIEELLQASIPGVGKSSEGVLVMPFYLKPGFISGFGFIGSKDQMSYVNVLDGHAGGFCGLNSCHKDDSHCVYTLPHPLQAARIVHKCAVERYNKISVVAKAPIGELDPLLLPKETLLWVDDPDTAFLKTCVKVRNFKIMADDTPYIWRPTEKVSKLWEGNFMPYINNRLQENRLLDPLDFLVNALLTMGRVNARNAVDSLELTGFQKNLILSSCSDDIRDDMEAILEHVVSSQPLMIDKKIMFERDGKLWVQGSREIGDEVVCNAILRITHVCRIKQGGAAALFGKMVFEGKEVGFQMSEDDLEQNPAKALAYIASTSGMSSQPFLSDSIAKKYVDIVMRLSTPEVHSVQNYVGFDPDTGRFNLPRVSIDTDQIRVGVPFVMSEVEPPCANVVVDAGLTVKSIYNIFEAGPETVVYLSAMAGVISSIYSNINEGTRTNTLLVGSKGSLAEYIFDVIRIDLGLDNFALLGKDDVEAAQILSSTHQVPVAIDGLRSNPKLLGQWMESHGRNSLVLGNSLTASAMGQDKDWSFVRADTEFSDETRDLLNSENVFPFFMQYALTVRPTSAHAFLDSLKYLCKSLSLDPVIMDLAKGCISSKGYINTKASGIHLMNFIQEGVEQGVFKTFTGDTSRKRYVVFRNPMEDTVTVDLTNLLGQMRFYHLPVVTWESSVEQLKALGAQEVSKNGTLLLVFPKPLWNSLISAVKRMKSLRRARLASLFNLT